MCSYGILNIIASCLLKNLFLMSVILLLCLLLLFLFAKKTQSQKTQTETNKLIELSKVTSDAAQWVYYACQIEGLSPLIASFVVAQTAHETGYYTSRLCVQCNNLSGICYSQRAVRLLGSENVKEDNGYASYSSVVEWLYDYVNLMQTRYQEALQAQNLKQFCAALKKKGYYTAAEDSYYTGCLRAYNKYSNIFV